VLLPLALLLMLNVTMVGFASGESSYLLEQELAFDDSDSVSKFELQIEQELNLAISENWQFTMINRLRFDPASDIGPANERGGNYSGYNGPVYGGRDGSVDIREAFLDGQIGDSYWRIGKQQVVWGQADGLKVLDVINPQSFREFILDDFESSRIPLWMLNVEFSLSDTENLQLLWIPDSTYNDLAETDSEFSVTSELLLPSLPEQINVSGFVQQRPNAVFGDSEFGVRYSNFHRGWDLSANYFYHFHDNPVVYQELNPNGIQLHSQYKRNHLTGLTASKAFGSFTFRGEVGYNDKTYHFTESNKLAVTPTELILVDDGIFESAEVASVFGLDWQGLEDSFISLQWFQSYLVGYEEDRNIVRDESNNVTSFLFQRTFNNEAFTFDFLALHGFNYQDGSVQMKLTYQLESNINIWVGTDLFYGDSAGLFGQFDKHDRIILGWQWGL